MIPKFRAFYKANQKMYEVLTLDIIDKKALIENSDNPEKPLRGYAKMDEIELMQSTGLFDKKGVEIFEGDIVEHTRIGFEDKKYRKNGYLGYMEGVFLIIYKIDEKNKMVDGLYINYAIDAKVIENVYENPEMLEVEE